MKEMNAGELQKCLEEIRIMPSRQLDDSIDAWPTQRKAQKQPQHSK